MRTVTLTEGEAGGRRPVIRLTTADRAYLVELLHVTEHLHAAIDEQLASEERSYCAWNRITLAALALTERTERLNNNWWRAWDRARGRAEYEEDELSARRAG